MERAKAVSPGWWRTAWIDNFRTEQHTFNLLVRRYGHRLQRQAAHLRRTISKFKSFAILTYFLAHAQTFRELAALIHVGASTAASIVHEGVLAPVGIVTQENIIFPKDRQLRTTMERLELLAKQPMCCGDVDGTFMKIVKPEEYGDSYWCYKQFSAILVFVCVDALGRFTCVDIGAPGSVGDTAVYNSHLKS